MTKPGPAPPHRPHDVQRKPAAFERNASHCRTRRHGADAGRYPDDPRGRWIGGSPVWSVSMSTTASRPATSSSRDCTCITAGPVWLPSGLSGNSIVSQSGSGYIFLFQIINDPNGVASLNSLIVGLSGWKGKTLPTTFNGSKVTIGSKNAPVIFVSPRLITCAGSRGCACGRAFNDISAGHRYKREWREYGYPPDDCGHGSGGVRRRVGPGLRHALEL